jgi:hypothetical protein
MALTKQNPGLAPRASRDLLCGASHPFNIIFADYRKVEWAAGGSK